MLVYSTDEELLFDGDASCEDFQDTDDPESSLKILTGGLDCTRLTTISSHLVKCLID